MQMTYYRYLNFCSCSHINCAWVKKIMFVVVENENPALTECMVFMVACLM